MQDIQTARNAQVDMAEHLKREDIEENRRLARRHLHDVYRSHPVASLMPPPSATSSSFDLSRELSGVITPPKAKRSSLFLPSTPANVLALPNTPAHNIPISQSPLTPNVSPIPIQQSPKSPPLVASSPPKRPYVRKTSAPASPVETQGETGNPQGKQIEAKPRGRPTKKAA